MRKGLAGVILAMVAAASAGAQSREADSTDVSFGGFVDSYFAFDFNRPPERDRAFTTQAVRHNEFNINLAFVEAVVTSKRIRGRLAAQVGTSVQANFAAEPRVGSVSGPELSQLIQEAVVGYRVIPSVWIDAGIFLSSFGSETWISRDNWTYTRSLIAEYSPYYESGIKATWAPSRRVSTQVHVINGWQNISENNSAKAIGLRLDYSPVDAITLSYDLFAGNEPDSSGGYRRVWHDVIVTLNPAKVFAVRATLDYGSDAKSNDETGHWWGYAVIGRYMPRSKVTTAVRFEHYEDAQQRIVTTGLPHGLRATGWSVNLDVAPVTRLLGRLEYRQLSSPRPVFSSTRGLVSRNQLLVGSAALTF